MIRNNTIQYDMLRCPYGSPQRVSTAVAPRSCGKRPVRPTQSVRTWAGPRDRTVAAATPARKYGSLRLTSLAVKKQHHQIGIKPIREMNKQTSSSSHQSCLLCQIHPRWVSLSRRRRHKEVSRQGTVSQIRRLGIIGSAVQIA